MTDSEFKLVPISLMEELQAIYNIYSLPDIARVAGKVLKAARPFSTVAVDPSNKQREVFEKALRCAHSYLRRTPGNPPEAFAALVTASFPMLAAQAVGAVQEETEHPQRLQHEGKWFELKPFSDGARYAENDAKEGDLIVCLNGCREIMWRDIDTASKYEQGRIVGKCVAGGSLYRPVVEPQPPQPQIIECESYETHWDGQGFLNLDYAGFPKGKRYKVTLTEIVENAAAEGVGAQEVDGS